MNSSEESFGIIPLSKENDFWRVFLILHKGARHWGFPKGHSNPGEKGLETAQRELTEETGLRVTAVLRENPFVEHYTFRRRGEVIYKKVNYFPALVVGEPILQPEEIAEGKWCPLHEAEKTLTFHEARQICREVTNYVESL